ncbi:unnamed protein product [Mytilus edulis]|uniref:Uncharacterized protein n=1 Tax=Mytilus edulis TaxID=6550 RepID=A0A8S3USE6_MYTED|nr:unnamed protein product [Mytilus edulis]
MEDITNIPPLGKRRECKAIVQATKYQCSQDHPMNTRLKQLSSGRLKRSSFTLETRALQRKHQEALPKYIEPIVFTMNNTPCEEKLGNVTIQTSVPLITTKDEQTSNVKKTLTMSMLEEQYPSETWVRVYTDESAINATTNGGAVWGNEQPDRLAKYGAEQQQEENPVCFTEMKTIIKSLFNTPQQQDSYHQLTRSEQTTIFRLRTGHNRLNQHLHKVMKVVPSPMCPCGEAEQDTAHLLQSCNLHQALRDKIWHSVTSLEEKLYGPVDSLQKTTRFVEETGIQV